MIHVVNAVCFILGAAGAATDHIHTTAVLAGVLSAIYAATRETS